MNPPLGTKHSIVFVVTGFNRGGAENSLIQLLSHFVARGYRPILISLKDEGDYQEEIESLGIPFYPLKMHLSVLAPLQFLKLVWLLHFLKPQVLATWMYHANLIGGLAGYLARVPRIYFNIRHMSVTSKHLKPLTRILAILSRYVARLVATEVVFNSYASAGAHIAVGYPGRKATVIVNGFDPDVFRPDERAPAALRKELGLPLEKKIVLFPARFDRIKGHRAALKVMAEWLKKRPNTVLVLAGVGTERDNSALRRMIDGLDMEQQCLCLGRRTDMPYIIAGSDVVMLASASESFPRVLGESLSCGVPCVSTDVGEARSILGASISENCGIVVDSIQNIPQGIDQLLQSSDEERKARSIRGRARIITLFPAQSTLDMYEKLFSS